MTYRTEDSDRCKDWLTQRPDNLGKYLHVRRTIDKCTLLQLCRNRLNISLNQDDIVWSHDTRNDVYHVVVCQTQHNQVQICCDQTCVKVHCDNDCTIPQTSVPHLLLGYEITNESRCKYHQSRTENSSGDRYDECISKITYTSQCHVVREVDSMWNEVDHTTLYHLII